MYLGTKRQKRRLDIGFEATGDGKEKKQTPNSGRVGWCDGRQTEALPRRTDLVIVLDELDAKGRHALLPIHGSHVAAHSHVRVESPLLGHVVDLKEV